MTTRNPAARLAPRAAIAAIAALVAAAGCASNPQSTHDRGAHARTVAQATLTEAEAFEIGVEAYHFFYPLISMEITRRVTTNGPAGAKPGMGPMNAFHHLREYPSAEFREVVRPNFDTLYSIAWIDVSREPQIISAPDTQGRYYLLPIIDMWSNVIAAPGKRTTGTDAASWAIVPKGWSGRLPTNVGRIEATTPHLWVIGRTQTNGPADYAAVHAIQDQYKVVPLSRWGRSVQPPQHTVDPSIDMKTPPLVQINTMPADRYFALAADLMTLHPPAPTDWSIVARLERIGIVPGKPFNLADQPPHVQAALTRAVPAGLEGIKQRIPTLARISNGWQMNTETMGSYGIAYLKRACIALAGLGANQPEDAIYPFNVADADGNPLKGESRYEFHFPKDQLPPVDAFWSLTMYDADGFQVANPINRFAIGDRDPLTYNPDGSLTIYIQHDNPGPDKQPNWLPSPPSGTLGVTLRLYAPRPEIINGRWNPPPIRRVN